MRIVGRYSFNGGLEAVSHKYPELLREVESSIHAVNASLHKTKESEERTMAGKLLYSPSALNAAVKQELSHRGWKTHRVQCEYPTEFYVEGYVRKPTRGAFREMDFVKERLGVEIQFGKYAFMVYNVCAKMTIFANRGLIDTGIEVVPIKSLAEEMSSGVSYFEQFVWDLEQRGVSNIDVPVLILGIDDDDPPHAIPTATREASPRVRGPRGEKVQEKPRQGARPGPKPKKTPGQSRL